MKENNMETNTQTFEKPKRRLSLFRLLLLLVILTGIVYGTKFGIENLKEDIVVADSPKPWFAAYVDITATPQFDFEKLGNTQAHNLVLSFIVSSSKNPCTPTWGNAYDLSEAGVVLDLDRRIARLRQLGGEIAISFGGAINDELAIKCTDSESLLSAYRTVIDKYQIDTIDLDIEKSALSDTESIERRAQAISSLQKEKREKGEDLAVWLTLPVTPQGLTEEGTNIIAKMLEKGVDLAGVNIMTMDYGQSKEKDLSMQLASQQALLETHRQLEILYTNANIILNSSSVWQKIGMTPMIGQNDFTDEIFTLDDAKELNVYAIGNKIARVSIWSANRDIQCGENYVNLSVVSDSCSGVKQDELAYSTILSNGFEGELSLNAKVITKQDSISTVVKQDNPETSPYQIWSEEGVYLKDTKVVWHWNVYQAKWWTQGDLPDNPVLQYWETPWQLLGPVLPNEKPVKLPTLPEGTYPEWGGTEQYDKEQRVLFDGRPYEAKWWTQGDSPAAESSDPNSSPWKALTQKEIEEVLNEKVPE